MSANLCPYYFLGNGGEMVVSSRDSDGTVCTRHLYGGSIRLRQQPQGDVGTVIPGAGGPVRKLNTLDDTGRGSY